MNLILFEPGEPSDFLGRSDPRHRHILRVLRSRPGDRLRGGRIGGELFDLEVVGYEDEGLVLRELGPREEAPPVLAVSLLLGHPRPIVLQRILRDAAAFGLEHLVVATTTLSERSYEASGIWDGSRVRDLLKEGASQGRTTRLPLVDRAGSLGAGLALLSRTDGCGLLLDPGADLPFLARAGAGPAAPRRFRIAVGPERGFTEDEGLLLRDAGLVGVRVGPRTLRTETAVTAALALCTAVLDGSS